MSDDLDKTLALDRTLDLVDVEPVSRAQIDAEILREAVVGFRLELGKLVERIDELELRMAGVPSPPSRFHSEIRALNEKDAKIESDQQATIRAVEASSKIATEALAKIEEVAAAQHAASAEALKKIEEVAAAQKIVVKETKEQTPIIKSAAATPRTAAYGSFITIVLMIVLEVLRRLPAHSVPAGSDNLPTVPNPFSGP
jgi:predicted  nucleic acid-binding Zn-ribbon protein